MKIFTVFILIFSVISSFLLAKALDYKRFQIVELTADLEQLRKDNQLMASGILEVKKELQDLSYQTDVMAENMEDLCADSK